MGLFSRIFGTPKEIEFVKETNKRLHEIIHNFLILEEINKEEVEKAEVFLKKSDADTLKELIICIHKRTKIQEGRINDLKTILETEREELKSMMIASNLEDKKNEQIFEKEIAQIKTTFELDEEDQKRLILFAKKYHGDDVSESLHVLINNRDEINNVIKIIYKQAKILQQDEELLKKLEAQLPKIDRGLVNNLLKKIVINILNESILPELNKIKEAKFHLEEHAFKKDIDHQLEYYKNKIIEGKEPELLKQALSYKKDTERILVVLRKLLTKEQHSVYHGKIKQMIAILEFIFEKKLLKKLIALSKKEVRALKNNKIEKFIKNYQEEKIISINLIKYLQSIGAEKIIEGPIKTGYLTNPATLLLTFGPELSVAAMFIGFIIYMHVTNSPQEIKNLMYGLSSVSIPARPGIKYLNRDLKEKIISLLEKKQPVSEDLKNEAKELEIKYGFEIRGIYNKQTLNYLKDALKLYHPFETKKILNTIYYVDTNTLFELTKNVAIGMYNPADKNIYFYFKAEPATIQHELAHARQAGLGPRFKSIWKSESEKVINYNIANTLALNYHEWADTKKEYPSYGFARPYGTTDWKEDLATMVELLHEETIKELGDLQNPKYQSVYMAKADLLLKAGIIADTEYLRFKRIVLKLN